MVRATVLVRIDKTREEEKDPSDETGFCRAQSS